MSAHQKALDQAHEREMNSNDTDDAKAAESQAKNLRTSFGFSLYCPLHRNSHHLGADDIEALIYGLQGDLVDLRADASSGQVPPGQYGTPDQELASLCPVQDRRQYGDGEAYYEHIESWVEARRASVDVDG